MTYRFVFLLIPKDKEKEPLIYTTNTNFCGMYFDNDYHVFRFDTELLKYKRLK